MVPMAMEFDRIILKAESTQGAHVDGAQAGAEVLFAIRLPAAADDLTPRTRRELSDGVVRFAAQGNIAADLAHGGAGGG
jgi:hypothetical protein